MRRRIAIYFVGFFLWTGGCLTGWLASPDDRPPLIGAGWRDPCVVVPAGTARPLEWSFYLGPAPMASGHCR